ncbi:uncharacterized protein BKA55DRAFT_667251 [Fusarium redolens]|uniref:Uncharacterized protein n=1 Tax=Fusarium redolens TaxID=48865 RepID=A0A9P9JVK1_FUSRE|nr:uncharacterized protein BKA55DRAFT_667251 [Fusarium redolens]KAH7234015.1 hypothetical protein BKA55DRAFT_667251 [Fusarium redolens]
MYYDGQDFPAKSAVGWVSAKNLRDSGVKSKNSLIPHIQSVRKFLESRVAKHSPKHETDETRTGIPNTTEEQPIKLNTNSAMLPGAQSEPHEAHGSTPELVSRSGSQVQSQSQPGIHDREERNLPPGVEVISISSHRSEEQSDEPLGIFEPRPLTALTKAMQEKCQKASPTRLYHGSRENRSTALEKPVETGPSDMIRLAQATLDVVCPLTSLQKGQPLVNQGSQSLEEAERCRYKPVPSRNLYNLEVPRASCFLPPIGFMLQQDMGGHLLLRELHGQVPTDTDRLFSHRTLSMQAPLVPSSYTRLPTTQPMTLSPAVKPSRRQPASNNHPVTRHPIGQNYCSLARHFSSTKAISNTASKSICDLGFEDDEHFKICLRSWCGCCIGPSPFVHFLISAVDTLYYNPGQGGVMHHSGTPTFDSSQLRETSTGHWLRTRCSQRNYIHRYLLPAGTPDKRISSLSRLFSFTLVYIYCPKHPGSGHFSNTIYYQHSWAQDGYMTESATTTCPWRLGSYQEWKIEDRNPVPDERRYNALEKQVNLGAIKTTQDDEEGTISLDYTSAALSSTSLSRSINTQVGVINAGKSKQASLDTLANFPSSQEEFLDQMNQPNAFPCQSLRNGNFLAVAELENGSEEMKSRAQPQALPIRGPKRLDSATSAQCGEGDGAV